MEGGQVGWNDLIGRVGEDLPIRRSYKPPGPMPVDFAHCEAAMDAGHRAAFWSAKFETGNGYVDWVKWANGGYDAWYLKFKRSVPLDMLLLETQCHEPDGGGGLAADGHVEDFLAGWARFDKIHRQVNEERRLDGGTLMLRGPCLMRSSLVWSPWDIDEWTPPAEQVDFLGIDGYWEGWPAGSWLKLFEPVFAWAARYGKPVVVGETGPWDAPAGGREAWVLQAVADAKVKITEGTLLAWMYWNNQQNQLVTDAECAALAS